MMLHGDHGSAWRRRQRRLRSWWRHEQQSVAMALSAAAQHSFDKVAAGEKFNALRGQKTDRARREVEDREFHDAPRRQKLPPRGTRPAPLVEVRPQAETRAHAGIGCELVLNPVVPQMAEQLVEVFSLPALVVEYISTAPEVLPPAPVVESILHAFQQWFHHLFQWWSTLHPRPQCFKLLCPLWSTLHPRQRCPNRQRQVGISHPLQPCFKHQLQWLSILPPRQRCPNRRRQLWRTFHPHQWVYFLCQLRSILRPRLHCFMRQRL